MSNEKKFLIDTLTKNLILKVINDYNYSITDAMNVVYGLYYQSAGYNYELLKREIEEGKLF